MSTSITRARVALSFTLLLPFLAHAQSSVRVYGLLDTYAGTYQPAGTSRLKVVNSGGLTTSFLGYAGEEDLGGGATAFFKLESYLLPDTGVQGAFPGDVAFSRFAYVGMRNAAGEVKIGRLASVLFFPTALGNPFGASYKFSPQMTQLYIAAMGQALAGGGNFDNAVEYTTPVIAGLQADLYVSAQEVTGKSSVGNDGGWLNYTSGPLSLTGGWQRVKVGPGITAATPSQRAAYLGGIYDFKVVKLYASWVGARSDGTLLKQTMGQVGASIPIGAAGFVLASAARTRSERPGVADSSHTGVALAYDYYLSKRSDLYAAYLNDKQTGVNTGNSLALGIRHRF